MYYTKLLIDMKSKPSISNITLDNFQKIFKDGYKSKLDIYVTKLTNSENNVVQAIYIDRLTKDEISQQLGIKLKTVDSLLSSSYKKFQQFMKIDLYCHENNLTTILALNIPNSLLRIIIQQCKSIEELAILINKDKLYGLSKTRQELIKLAIKNYDCYNNLAINLVGISDTYKKLEQYEHKLEQKVINELDYLITLSNNKYLFLTDNGIYELQMRLSNILKALTNDSVIYTKTTTENTKHVIIRIYVTLPTTIGILKKFEVCKIKIHKL